MTIEEINMPVYVAAFNIAYDNYKFSDLPYEELIVNLKRETNLVYHMMIEVALHLKK